eukprot:1904551-Amphidinium_carterae.1
MTRGQIGADGRTAHERLRGVPYCRALPPFGEVVMARDDSKESRVQQRWNRMIFLGVVPKSNALYVGDSQGVQVMRSIRRLPPSESSDAVLLDAVRGTPWALKPTLESVPAGPITVDATETNLPPPP